MNTPTPATEPSAVVAPCPFCGKTDHDDWPIMEAAGDEQQYIRCAWCLGAAPKKAWNRRAPAAAVGGDWQKFPYSVAWCDALIATLRDCGEHTAAEQVSDIKRFMATPAAPVGGVVVGTLSVYPAKVGNNDNGDSEYHFSGKILPGSYNIVSATAAPVGDFVVDAQPIAYTTQKIIDRALSEQPIGSITCWKPSARDESDVPLFTAQPSAKDGVRGELPLQGNVADQARAWIGVTELLDELSPDWQERPGLGKDIALDAIRDLATTASGLVDEAAKFWRDKFVSIREAEYLDRAFDPSQAREYAENDAQAGDKAIAEATIGLEVGDG